MMQRYLETKVEEAVLADGARGRRLILAQTGSGFAMNGSRG